MWIQSSLKQAVNAFLFVSCLRECDLPSTGDSPSAVEPLLQYKFTKTMNWPSKSTNSFFWHLHGPPNIFLHYIWDFIFWMQSQRRDWHLTAYSIDLASVNLFNLPACSEKSCIASHLLSLHISFCITTSYISLLWLNLFAFLPASIKAGVSSVPCLLLLPVLSAYLLHAYLVISSLCVLFTSLPFNIICNFVSHRSTPPW